MPLVGGLRKLIFGTKDPSVPVELLESFRPRFDFAQPWANSLYGPRQPNRAFCLMNSELDVGLRLRYESSMMYHFDGLQQHI